MGLFKKHGNYYVDYYAYGKRKREKVSPSKRQAELLLKKRKVEIAEGKFFDIRRQNKIRFFGLCDTFLSNYSKPNKSPKAHRSDQLSVKHLTEYFGDELITRITPKMIEKYKSFRRSKVKPATVNREIACLKNMYNRAIDWDMTDFNPMKRVKLFHESPGRVRFLSKDEIPKLLAQCCSSGYLYSIVATALNTGMRLGENLGLKWDDIDFDNAVIHVSSTSSKNKRGREIPINNTLMRTLKNIKRNPASEYVFCDETGKRFKKIRRSFMTALRRAGISNFRFHDLRHTFCSHLVMAGVDIYTVKELAGHRSIEMTMRYSHLTPNHKKRAMDILSTRMDTIWTPEPVDNPATDILSTMRL